MRVLRTRSITGWSFRVSGSARRISSRRSAGAVCSSRPAMRLPWTRRNRFVRFGSALAQRRIVQRSRVPSRPSRPCCAKIPSPYGRRGRRRGRAATGSVIVVGLVGFHAMRRSRTVRGLPAGRALGMRNGTIDLAGWLRPRVSLVRVPASVGEPLRARWCRLRSVSHRPAPRDWARNSAAAHGASIGLGPKQLALSLNCSIRPGGRQAQPRK